MAGIALPAWNTLKANLLIILQAVAAEEAAVDPGRNFAVSKDRWRPWIEQQQNIALVNIMVETVEPDTGRSGTRRFKQDKVTVNLDMYALGTYEEQEVGGVMILTPADEVAALRLDLLVAQVRSAIMRMVNADFGFAAGMIDTGGVIASLQTYSQEREEATGQYAPARWSFQVSLPYVPQEGPDLPELSELNLTFKRALEDWAVKFTYPPN